MQNPFESTLLILDDDRSILESMKLVFEDRIRRTITTDDPDRIIRIIREESPDALMMDMNYTKGAVDGHEGLALLDSLKKAGIQIPIIVMTAYGEIDLVVKCMQLGAVDFIQKPWSNQRLLITVSNALKLKQSESKVESLSAENAYYKKEQLATGDLGMIGSSNAMKLLRERITKAADSDANVLVLGENGTGKELVAKAIHDQSPRSTASFIKIDLGSVHDQLFESEMFGAKKGSYTGSQQEKKGRITLANDGTLFLDEIGNLPLNMQSKMLSVLQNRELIPVGGTHPEKINIRVVSATNMKVGELLDEQVFRQDLLYRINTVEIHLPPLRERSDDISELFNYFKSQYEKKYQKSVDAPRAVLKEAQQYAWPGNVRELQHAVERAVLMCTDHKIGINDLLPNRRLPESDDPILDLNIERMERKLIEQALKRNQGNMTRASSDLGLTRAALYRRLEKYNL